MGSAIFTYSNQLAGNSPLSGVAVWVYMFVISAALLLMVVGMWQMFEKAGESGWAAVVPGYNVAVLLKISYKPVWWLLLLLIPFVNLIALIYIYFAVAKVFGQGLIVTLLTSLFVPLAFVYMGFSRDVKYVGTANRFQADWESCPDEEPARHSARVHAIKASTSFRSLGK